VSHSVTLSTDPHPIDGCALMNVDFILRNLLSRCQTSLYVLAAAFFAASVLSGCSSSTTTIGGNSGGSGGSTGSTVVSVTIKDTPPTGITLLSFELTITGITLNPASGSTASIVSSANPVPIELGRLQTDSAFVASASVPAGLYNSMTISVANTSFTFFNNTGSPISVSGVTCANGDACRVTPTTAANIQLITSPFPLTLTSGAPAALLLEFDLNKILNTSLVPTFSGSTGVSATAMMFTSAVTPVTRVDGLFGQVTAIDLAHNNFTISNLTLSPNNAQNATRINFDSNSTFRDFLSANCTTQSSSCLAIKQVLDVDTNLMSDGTLLATGVTFEDSSLNEAFAEGQIFAIDNSTQFHMVVLNALSSIAGVGPSPGEIIPVTLNGSTTFSVDDEGPDTTPFTFVAESNLAVGQVVQIKELSSSSPTTLQADRVRLRDSQLTATVSAAGTPNFTVNFDLRSLFTAAGFNQMQVQTSSATSFSGTVQSASQATVGKSVTIRGQIFRSASSSTTLVMPASLVVGN
jgi:hypothetical protein